jgi:hypothetical protein
VRKIIQTKKNQLIDHRKEWPGLYEAKERQRSTEHHQEHRTTELADPLR